MAITDQEHIAINTITEKYFGQSITHVHLSMLLCCRSVLPSYENNVQIYSNYEDNDDL